MRDTETIRRLLGTVAVAAAIGFMLGSAPAHATDDDDPVRDDGIMGNIMRGLGGADGSNGINYRERSPLVVPRQLTLPPPETRRPEAANWPKDPDVQERRAKREAARKRNKEDEANPALQIMPQREPDLGQARARTATVAPQPGVTDDRRAISEGNGILSPSQLGVTKNLFQLFGAKREDDNVKFTGEPVRESLTQPPPGYQTPAANQAYGISDTDRARMNEPTGASSYGILPPGKF
jgi:hypothetical protein